MLGTYSYLIISSQICATFKKLATLSFYYFRAFKELIFAPKSPFSGKFCEIFSLRHARRKFSDKIGCQFVFCNSIYCLESLQKLSTPPLLAYVSFQLIVGVVSD